MAFALLDQIRSIFDGDPGVRKVADDPVLSAELLMLFRMILADGTVSESEMVAFRRICKEAFDIPETSIDAVIEYLNEFGYETNGAQAIALFRDLDLDRRRQLAQHMAEIAKADSQLAETEVRLLRRTLDLLGISPVDVVAPQDLGQPAALRGGSALLPGPPGNRPVQVGSGRDQRLGRIRAGMVQEFGRLAALDDLAFIHDQHLVGDGARDGQVMRDEKVGYAEFLVELGEQV
jgi:uncharacterized tellurite resistance protein B-like protein